MVRVELSESIGFLVIRYTPTDNREVVRQCTSRNDTVAVKSLMHFSQIPYIWFEPLVKVIHRIHIV